MSRSLIALATLATISAPAFAQGFYADAGYTFINIDVEEEGVSGDLDLGALAGHVGYNFSEWFAIEGEALIGVQDEEASFEGINASVGLNYLVGAYAKGQIPLAERVNLYARAGLVQAEVEAEVSGGGFSGSESDSETGAGYGAGAEFMLTPALGLRGDYTRYDIEDTEADAFTLAAVFRF